jgi:predicted transposase YbfD/YdcC
MVKRVIFDLGRLPMKTTPIKALEIQFGKVGDPRVNRTKEHKLIDLITISICAIICGAQGWTEIEMFGNQKYAWFKTFLELPGGIPSHDTFGRVFAMLDPQEFQDCFIEWVEMVSEITSGQEVSIDGKQLRGSDDSVLGKRAIYMVSAWAEENHLVLGQRTVEAKSNEITAIPKLLKVLAITGCIVTIDAIGTQTKIAKTIIDREADYLLSVKENQGNLYQDILMLFEYDKQQGFKNVPYDYVKTVNKGHGRLEIRECWCTSDLEYIHSLRGHDKWKNLRSIAMVISTRIVNGEETKQVRLYISSLNSNAKLILHAARRHWSIENELHWVLDVALNEDHSRVRKDHAPANLSVLRHIALNLLKQEKSAKAGVHAKQLRAALDQEYLLKVLASQI